MKKRMTMIFMMVSLVVAGCANMNKEEIGTALGAIAGAVIGKQLGGDRGAAIGLVLGGAVGNRLGAHLDEEDKKMLTAMELRALDTGDSGAFVTTKTKATVSVVASPSTLIQSHRFVLSNTLTPYPLVVIDQETVWAFVDTPVYSSLDTKSQPKMVIQQGVPIRITANVVNENWAVVGENNLGIGYVPRRYLESSIVGQLKEEAASAKIGSAKVPPGKPAGAKAKAPPSTQVAAAQRTGATGNKPSAAAPVTTTQVATAPVLTKVQLDKEMATLAEAAKPGVPGVSGAQGSSPTMQSAVLVVQASTECKVLTRTVDAGPSNSFTENVKYCKEPPKKGWQTQTV